MKITDGIKSCLNLSITELKYVQTHQYIYDELFSVCSADEFQLKYTIYGCDTLFTLLDYLVIFVIYSSRGNKTEILIDLIDAKFFDMVLRNTNFVKRLVLAFRNYFELGTDNMYKVLAHIFKQYPGYLKMNFMFIKFKFKNLKTGKPEVSRIPYFTLDKVEQYF